jgi:hypothetical protein
LEAARACAPISRSVSYIRCLLCQLSMKDAAHGVAHALPASASYARL